MNITLISGSGRAGSQTRKVTHWLEAVLADQGVTTNIVDVMEEDYLPLLHEEVWGDVNGAPAEKLRAKLADADGYVVVTPEWHGMANPALKNLLMYVGKSMANKPALLVAVTATPTNGHYPLAELRINTAKNTRIVYVPEDLIVRDVNSIMNHPAPDAENDADKYVQGRAHYALNVLLAYAEAMKPLQTSDAFDYETYPNGM